MRRRRYPLSKRVALRLLEWYPRPWRERYLAEMQALLEEIPVGWKQTANVAAIAMREWLSPRALGWPARTAAGRIMTARRWMFFAGALMMDGFARTISWQLDRLQWSFGEPLEWVAGVMMLAAAIRVFLIPSVHAMGPRPRDWATPGRRWRRPLAGRDLVICVLLLLPYLAWRHHSWPPSYAEPDSFTRVWGPYVHILQLWVWSFMGNTGSLRTWRLKRIDDAARQKSFRARWIDPGDNGPVATN